MLHRRTLLAGAAAGSLATMLPTTAEAALRVGTVLARDLRVPWGLAFLPQGAALVTERPTGRVHRVTPRGERRVVGQLPVDPTGEGGVLGIALHPDFSANRWVYLYVTQNGRNRIVRSRLQGELGPTQTVLDGIPAAAIHNGGRIRFGPDGMLYAGTGDAGDTRLAQRRDSLGGKILRITPEGGVPAGNPFGNAVWSYGHRNVQGIDWDGQGRMWASELGQSVRDELNQILPGRNYGWPLVEGGDGSGPFADPFVTWTNEECSPSGITVAAGQVWVAALRGQCLWSVQLNGPGRGRKVRYLHETFRRLRTVEQAPDGSLWITTSNNDGGNRAKAPRDDRVIRIHL